MHIDTAPMLLDNPIYLRQTQSGALSDRLGGKKRIENVRQVTSGWIPNPIIADFDSLIQFPAVNSGQAAVARFSAI